MHSIPYGEQPAQVGVNFGGYLNLINAIRWLKIAIFILTFDSYFHPPLQVIRA